MKKNFIVLAFIVVMTTGCPKNETSEWVANINLATTIKVGDTNTVTLSYKIPSTLTAPPAYPMTREQLITSNYKIYAYMCTTCGLLGGAYYTAPGNTQGFGNPALHPIFPEVEFIEPAMLPDRLPVVVEATYNAETQMVSASFKYKAVNIPTEPNNGYTALGGGFFFLPSGINVTDYTKARWFAGSHQMHIIITP